jgi:hypothetical protein
LSATERTFSIHLAVALTFGIVFTEDSHYTHDKLRVAISPLTRLKCCQWEEEDDDLIIDARAMAERQNADVQASSPYATIGKCRFGRVPE